LMLMRERILLLEGQFELQTAPGQGTTIKISLPYINYITENEPYQGILPDVTTLNG